MSESSSIDTVAPRLDVAHKDLPRPAILIVDDRVENLVATRKILVRLGVDIVIARSGSEALACCLRQHFSVILMDVQMPVMDGFETADLLAQNEETKGSPIIFMSAISKDEYHVHRGYSSGAVDYMVKPFDPDILISKVRVFIALEEQRMAIAQLAEDFKQLSYRNSLILESAAMGILGIEASGNINFINSAGKVLLGASGDVIGKSVIPFLDGPEAVFSLWETHILCESCVRHSKLRQIDAQMYHTDGHAFAAEFTFSPLPAETGVCGGVLIFQDISARKLIADKLDKMAKYDDLTGVANRRLFRDVLDKRLSGAKRHGSTLGLLYIDIDNFKQVNDRQGHHAGDLLLQEFCERMLKAVRHGDTVGRMGGDEFAILVDDCSDKVGLFALAKKLINVCSASYLIENNPLNVGVSIGIALYPEQAQDTEALFRAADRAMYSVKIRTKNDFALFNNAMQA